mmetsp:Transcript_61266/g.177675  ORF Transcript_61266/g.177675 Transcript_61266/m.177675 type:complete len:209 (+) Transcript_61266:2-628(+)
MQWASTRLRLLEQEQRRAAVVQAWEDDTQSSDSPASGLSARSQALPKLGDEASASPTDWASVLGFEPSAADDPFDGLHREDASDADDIRLTSVSDFDRRATPRRSQVGVSLAESGADDEAADDHRSSSGLAVWWSSEEEDEMDDDDVQAFLNQQMAELRSARRCAAFRGRCVDVHFLNQQGDGFGRGPGGAEEAPAGGECRRVAVSIV